MTYTINQLKSKLKPMPNVEDTWRYPNCYAEANGKVIGLNYTEAKDLTTLVLDEEASELQFLYLSYNSKLEQVDIQVALPQLTQLYLNNCNIQHFEIKQSCPKLKQLYVEQQGFTEKKYDNKDKGKLKTLHLESGTCPALQFIEASNNGLSNFSLGNGFGALEYLYLGYNVLETVQFTYLPALNILDLKENKLQQLPRLSYIKTLECLYLEGNNLNSIDREQWDFDGNALERLAGYLSSMEKEGVVKKKLHEAKLILIGNGFVGKSSIRIKLINENADLPKEADRTPGLIVEPYVVKNLAQNLTQLTEAIDFKFNIWDFGGQGRYREVQQLFCSRKSLYLYVTAPNVSSDDEDNYVGYEYWLSMANAFNFDPDSAQQNSPILYVQNKCELCNDDNKFINQQSIRDKGFKNIQEFINISCENPMINFKEFREKINKSIALIAPDIFTAEYDENWIKVKEELEKLKSQNHISLKEYQAICARNGLNEIEQKEWLATLDRIGTVIYFGNNEKLKDWIVLNPDWVKNAICDVIDFDFYQEVAVLLPSFLPKIWKNYDEDEREHLKELLLAYNFCYEENGKYIVPALFSKEKPSDANDLQYDYELKLQYVPYLPAGTLHKFMVKLHKKIYNNLRWKSGVVLHDVSNNTFAEISEDWENHTIHIKLKGNANNLSDLWAIVHDTLKALNDELKNTRAMRGLDFEVFAKYKNKWRTFEDIEEYYKIAFSFLFGFENKRGPNSRPEDFDVENFKPLIEVKMPFEARDFKPFKDIKEQIKILFLSATPSDTQKLNTGKESRFKDLFAYFDKENKFDFKEEHGINRSQFKDFLVVKDPHILHYGGHGDTEGIILEDENLDGETLAELLQLSDNTQCVILNACNSCQIAEKIAEYIPFVVATHAPIDDRAAIAFARGFYRGIVAGKTIEQCFSLGVIEVKDEERNLKVSLNPEVLVLVKGVKYH